MPMDIGMYSDSEIKVALGVAIRELGFDSRVIHRSPHDFSAVGSGEYRLELAEGTLLDRSAAYAVERQAGYSCLDKNKREA